SFVCARVACAALGETKPVAKDTEAPNAQRRRPYVPNVVGEVSLTAFAPALPSPLRKTAPYGRPVHRLGDRAGRSPGSRVVVARRPSQLPSGRFLTSDSALTVAGAAADFRFICGLRVPSFVSGFGRRTSTMKCSLGVAMESRRRNQRENCALNFSRAWITRHLPLFFCHRAATLRALSLHHYPQLMRLSMSTTRLL